AAMSIDSKNAFGTVAIEKAMTIVYNNRKLRDSYRLLNFQYGRCSRVLFLDKAGRIVAKIDVQQGVKQGDSLGTAVYDVAEAPDLARVSLMNPDIEVWAIHDDVRFLGPPDKCTKAFDDWVAICCERNTEVQPTKSVLIYTAEPPLSQAVLTWLEQRKVKLERKSATICGGIVAVD